MHIFLVNIFSKTFVLLYYESHNSFVGENAWVTPRSAQELDSGPTITDAGGVEDHILHSSPPSSFSDPFVSIGKLHYTWSSQWCSGDQMQSMCSTLGSISSLPRIFSDDFYERWKPVLNKEL